MPATFSYLRACAWQCISPVLHCLSPLDCEKPSTHRSARLDALQLIVNSKYFDVMKRSGKTEELDQIVFEWLMDMDENADRVGLPLSLPSAAPAGLIPETRADPGGNAYATSRN
nr:hypothetical protein VW1_00080 [Enterobacter sp.]